MTAWSADPRALLSLAAGAIGSLRHARCAHADVRRYGAGGYDLFAVGKAALTMAADVVAVAAPRRALVVTTAEAVASFEDVADQLRGVGEVLVGEHPVPGPASLAAGQRAWDFARDGDVPLVVLISGGASAMMVRPIAGVSLEDLRVATGALLRSGLDIERINVVRRGLSTLKGGGLVAGVDREVRTFAMSDVYSDNPAAIGSGPTVARPGSDAEVLAALVAHPVWPSLPETVRRALGRPRRDRDSGRRWFRVCTTNGHARRWISDRLMTEGVGVFTDDEPVLERVDVFGPKLVDDAIRLQRAGWRGVWVYGGEPAVVVTGDGVGGRCQALALHVARALEGTEGICVLAMGTDGRDGPTDAAGAVVDGHTAAALRSAGIPLDEALARDDSHTALGALGRINGLGATAVPAGGAVIETGPTGINVMDLILVGIG